MWDLSCAPPPDHQTSTPTISVINLQMWLLFRYSCWLKFCLGIHLSTNSNAYVQTIASSILSAPTGALYVWTAKHNLTWIFDGSEHLMLVERRANHLWEAAGRSRPAEQCLFSISTSIDQLQQKHGRLIITALSAVPLTHRLCDNV